MMLLVIEELKSGNREIPAMFEKAEQIWSEALEGLAYLPFDALVETVTSTQRDIERACGSRTLGKQIMPWSAFAHLYNVRDGLGDNGAYAPKLLEAFRKSSCSTEVKAWAEDAAKAYGVQI